MLRKLIGLGSLVVLSLSAAAMGCSSSSSGDETPPLPFPDFSSFCTGVATAECSTTLIGDCNIASAKCTASVASNCMQGNLDFAPSSVTSLYDANQGKPCIDALTSTYASPPITAAAYEAARKTCASAFSKKGAKGASCTVDNDCDTANGLSCWFGNGTTTTTGECAATTMVPNGNDCSAPGSVCGDGYYCASVAQFHCINISNANGSACSSVDPCGAGEICDNVDANGMGVCGSAHQQGDNCADDAQCDTGLVCLDTGAGTKQCFMTLSFGPGSTTCNVFSEVITPAPANGGGGSGGSGGAAGSGGAGGDASTGGSAGAGGDSGGAAGSAGSGG